MEERQEKYERWIPPDSLETREDRERERVRQREIDRERLGFERELLFRISQLEKHVEHIDLRLESHMGTIGKQFEAVWQRVHLLEIAQAQVKVLAVAFATFTGIISTVLSKVWK